MIDLTVLSLLLLLLFPLVSGAICWFVKADRTSAFINLATSVILFISALFLAGLSISDRQVPALGTLIRADALSVYFAVTITLIYFFVSWFSISFLEREKEIRGYSTRRVKAYYCLMLLFTATMLEVVLIDNLGVMWVALEATTLSSGVLVAFSGSRQAIGAAWRYLILCTVGLALSLFGTVLIYYAVIESSGASSLALNWSYVISVAEGLDPAVVKIAFVFLLIGYGTKVGLAPLHTWLPDAHSHAPAPVSAMLSGVLLTCAMYAIMRFNTIADMSLVDNFNDLTLLSFGSGSVIFAGLMMLVQKEYKRALAYSSIEHMGIIAIGLGIGNSVAMFGVLLHVLIHAISKSMLFMAAGNIFQSTGAHRINEVSGLLKKAPYLSTALFIGVLAIAGSPPIGTFISDLAIIYGAFINGSYLIGTGLALMVLLVFSALLFGLGQMVLGETNALGKTSPLIQQDEPALPVGGANKPQEPEPGYYKPIFVLMAISIIVVSTFTPGPIVDIIDLAANIALDT